MWWQLAVGANLVISLAYFAISYAILAPLVREGQLRANRLGAATAAIFFSCGVGHGMHGIHPLLLSLGDHSVFAAASRVIPAHEALWDTLTAGVGVYYWTLRRTYGQLMRGAALFTDLQQQRQALELESQAAVTEARDLFSGVLDAATEQAIIGTDLTGRVTVFNTGAQRMLGYSAAHMLGRRAEDLYDRSELTVGGAGAGESAAIDQTPGGGASITGRTPGGGPSDTGRWTYVAADGRRLTVMQSVTAMHDAAGSVAGYITVGTDVTEQRRAEQALAASEAQFRLAFQHAPIGVALITLDGSYEQVNPALCTITGYSRAQFEHLASTDLTHPDDVAQHQATRARLVDGDVATSTVEQRYVTATGSVIWVSESASLLRRDDGSPVHLIVQVQDVTQRKDHDYLIAEERRRLRDAQAIGRVGSWERDLRTDAINWSDTLFDLYGVERGTPHGDYATGIGRLDAGDREVLDAAMTACIETGAPIRVRFRRTRQNDGELRWFDLRGGPIYEHGERTRLGGAIADVTDQVLAEQAVADSEAMFRLAFDTAPLGMAMIDLADRPSMLLRVNPALCALVGRSEEQLCRLDLAAISHPDDVEANRLMIEQLRTGTVEVHGEKRFLGPNGTTVWGQLAMSAVSPSDGRAAYGICLIEDITARKSAEEALLHQSLHDPLTGLANRLLLNDRIDHALAASSRSRIPVGLIYIDLDGFKQVNDSAGHQAGDAVLIQVAERLRRAVRPGDTIGRIGGDEYAIVCADVGDLETLRAVATRVLDTLHSPFALADGTHHISGSIGLVLSDESSVTEQLLANADAAMYCAKEAGKDRIATPKLEQLARAARTTRLLPELHEALSDGQLIMYGQPVVDMATGATIAVETLIRWRHPQRGVLPPSEFLDVAEHSPLMLPLGQRALTESCRMAARWDHQLGAEAPDVHVNVSGRQLESGSLTFDVLHALATSSLPADRLILELTETHMPAITDSLRSDLNRLRERGVRIAIDDLGTGHSSLTRITQLPVDILKIDLRFTRGLGEDPACDAVVRAVLSLGQAMGLSVIAEGVETAQQAELLCSYGCEAGQGYLYSRPRPEAELFEYLCEATAAEVAQSTP